MHDLVIRAATVVDGTGRRAPFVADVAVDGERIVAVGEVAGRGRRELDADGLVVTPGFVDIHTHYDGQVTWDPVVAPSSLHGVTSMVMGNCGVGFAPAEPSPDKHQWLIGLLEGVEDIPGTALSEGLTWDWESFPEYLDAVARRPHTVDLGAYVPHAPVRAYVMGERGADPDAVPTASEIEAMRRIVAEGVAAGAVGFATSRTFAHKTKAGANIGTYRAEHDEVLGVAMGLADAGRGVLQMISDAYIKEEAEFAASELALMRTLVERTGRRLSMSVQQPMHLPDRWREIRAFCREANEHGLTMRMQVAPRAIGLVLGHQGSLNPFALCPSYRPLADLPLAEKVAALRTAAVRERLLAEHAALPHGMGIAHSFDRFFRMTDPVDYEPSPEASIAGEAARSGRPVVEVLYDVLLEDEGRRLLYLPLFNFVTGDLSVVREMLLAPESIVGLSDGGAHCGFICDASFPTTLVAHWGRHRTRGERLPIELVVHHTTQRTAAHVGWYDRGVVAPGYLADLNVIDLDALGARPPHIVHDLPAGGRRLMQEASGYVATFKRGVATFEHGEHTGALPGTLVRGEQAAPAV